ncbi:CDP-glycerol glycerophosphotransferase family protein [Neobacillus drentensis]|uniref:CDP-glycerol glycerophosphotransferase family protein n=1 Tax=Neobacillus drentensis TaxID=220684 RepID=UPI00285F632E|nr:CDP-glycerol glycerophosphotransferase family protein [Neobacillus drentensis]MDR7240694.1 CDP-glycerol glycerophosphotransferase (TagB/SpsB family) [Neobacillus drentensis]
MVRELAITFYLFVFKYVFYIFNLLPLKDKTTFVISFGDNSQFVYAEMLRQGIDNQVVFLCKGKSLSLFNDYEGAAIISFESYNVSDWLHSIYHLATSRHIFVDNYFGFLAAIEFKEKVKCIQLWHASGAIKKFGLEDESINKRSEKAKRRFLQVYKKFDKVVVGSDIMANIFMKAFNLENNRVLKTGVPRTDFFFNKDSNEKSLRKLKQKNPLLEGKKVILYAPTYRDHELDHFSLQLDIEKIGKELGNDYLIILRLHPAIRNAADVSSLNTKNVFNYSSSEFEINDLLLAADYLITDYSSIPYEFSLMKKPMIFFVYDLEEYKKDRGLWPGFEESLPGPMVRDTDTIIELIKQNRFDINLVKSFAEKWNKYSKGNSSENLVHYVFEAEKIKSLQ